MNLRLVRPAIFISALGVFAFIAQAHAEANSSSAKAPTLSKLAAFEILKANGYQWKMTESLGLEADAKSAEARAALRPHAQIGVRQYAARINPVTFGGTNPETIDTVGFGTTALGLEWVVVDALSKAKVLTADANKKMTGAQTKHFQSELTALMLIRYLNVQRLKQQLDVMDANLAKSQLILRLVTAKKSVGAGIPLDVARAKNLVQLDQLKKISTYAKYTKARHELALTLGADRLEQELDRLVAAPFTTSDGAQMLSQTLNSRNDLKVAEIGVDAAGKAQRESGRKIFPKLELLAEFGTTQSTFFGFPAKNLNGFLGVALSIPLETGGLIQAKRAEAAAVHMKAEQQLKQTHAEIVSQVKEALEQLLAADEALKASSDYLRTSQEEALYSEQRYNSGASNILDLTTAHTNLVSAHDQRIEAIYNYEAAKVGYFRTIGDFTGYFALEKGE